MAPRIFKWTRTKKILLAILLVFFCLFAGTILHQRYWRVWSIPDVGEPFDVEAFKAQYRDDSGNAFDDYKLANAEFTWYENIPEELSFDTQFYSWETTHESLKTWLEENRSALKKWGQGAEKKNCIEIPIDKFWAGSDVESPQINRRFFRLAVLEAARLRYEGDLEGAWEKYKMILSAIRHQQCSGTIGFLTAYAMLFGLQERFSYFLADENMTPELLVRISEEYREIQSRYIGLSESLKLNYVMTQNSIGIIQAEENIFPLFVNEEEAYWRVMNLYCQQLLQYCDLPRWKRPELIEFSMKPDTSKLIIQIKQSITEFWSGSSRFCSNLGYFNTNKIKTDSEDVSSGNALKDQFEKLFSGEALIIFPTMTNELLQLDDRFRLNQKVIECQIQLQLYRLDTGEFPETMKELVPEYLSELPRDPFNEGKPVQYRRQKGGAVLWSLGPDQKNNQESFVNKNVKEVSQEDLFYVVFDPGTIYSLDISEDQTE